LHQEPYHPCRLYRKHRLYPLSSVRCHGRACCVAPTTRARECMHLSGSDCVLHTPTKAPFWHLLGAYLVFCGLAATGAVNTVPEQHHTSLVLDTPKLTPSVGTSLTPAPPWPQLSERRCHNPVAACPAGGVPARSWRPRAALQGPLDLGLQKAPRQQQPDVAIRQRRVRVGELRGGGAWHGVREGLRAQRWLGGYYVDTYNDAKHSSIAEYRKGTDSWANFPVACTGVLHQYFSANTCNWKVRLEISACTLPGWGTAAPYRLMVRRSVSCRRWSPGGRLGRAAWMWGHCSTSVVERLHLLM
jgi:hypothetical protein